MTIKSIQKVIKVGSSLAVTIPAKDARVAGVRAGSEVEITLKGVTPKQPDILSIDQEYQAFKVQYGETLKNLTDR